MRRSPEPTLTRVGVPPNKPDTTSDSSSDIGDSNDGDEVEVYEVEKIEDDRLEGSKRSFYVRWLGYPASDRSWEPEEVRRDHPLS